MHLKPAAAFADEKSKVLVLMFTFMSSLIHCFHVCVVSFSIVSTSLGEGSASFLAFSLLQIIYNICHYLFSCISDGEI